MSASIYLDVESISGLPTCIFPKYKPNRSIFATYHLDRNIAPARSSRVLSILMSFVEDVEKSDAFGGGACVAYL